MILLSVTMFKSNGVYILSKLVFNILTGSASCWYVFVNISILVNKSSQIQ